MYILFYFLLLFNHCFTFSTTGLNAVLKLHIGDKGEKREEGPLFLTPYIENNRIKEGRKLSRVTGLGWRETSYSGLLTVDKAHGSNTFFWYFPSEREPSNVPLLLHFNGYGTASSYGVFLQNGPYSLLNGPTLKRRTTSWQKYYHVLYIDNPVGVGFSSTRSASGFSTDFDHVADNLYSALTQFLQLFPELKSHDLYVTGLSLAGKYVMSLGYKIHQEKVLNFKGIFVGNPLLDPRKQAHFGDYLKQLSFVDWNQKKILDEKEKELNDYYDKGNYDQYFKGFSDYILIDDNYIQKITGLNSIYDYNSPYIDPKYYFQFISRPDVRRALHVGNTRFDYGTEAMVRARDVIVKSVASKMESILENNKILVFVGQMDIVCAYPMVTDVLRSLKWSGSEGYNNTARELLRDGDYVWGYSRNYKTLTDVLVRNASHSAVTNQPKYLLQLLFNFTQYQSF